MAIKVILLDIDGTLTNSKKQITPKTKEALLKVQESGVRLVLASGRPTNGLHRFARELDMYEHHGLFVCFNGGKVIDITANEELFSCAMSVEDTRAVLRHMRNFDVTPILNIGEYVVVEDVFHHDILYKGQPFNVLQREVRSNDCLLREVRNLEDAVTEPTPKILTYGSPEYLQAHFEELKAPFPHLSAMFTADYYYEFTAQGVDKTRAIQESLVKLGYTAEEMMAFGDAQNDLSMIRFAGIGVAMGNASEELKNAADEITLSNEEDGIARSLYKHFPELF